MEDWELEMRNELARKFRETVPEGRTDPVLDDDGKDMSHPLYGKKHMMRTRKLMSEKAMGNTRKKGTKVTDKSNMKKPGVHDGEGNPNYKGGVSMGDNILEYLKTWYERNKHHYAKGGKYYGRAA